MSYGLPSAVIHGYGGAVSRVLSQRVSTPLEIMGSGLDFEYSLTEGSGTTAGDISGNGRNATLGLSGSNKPSWTSRGLTFSQGLASLLALPAVRFAAVKSGSLMLWFKNSRIPTIQTVGNLPMLWAANSAECSIHPDGNVAFSNLQQGAGLVTLDGKLGWHGVAHVFDTTTRVYWDGIPSIALVNPSVAVSIGSSATDWWIGAEPGIGRFANMELAYVVATNTLPTTAQVAAIHAYVVSKLTLRSITIADTLALIPQAIGVGDSILAGSASSWGNEWFTLACKDFANCRYANGGVGFSRAVDVVGNVHARFGGLWRAGSVGLLALGTNDMGTAAFRTATQVYADLKTIAGIMNADGCSRIGVFTVLKRTAASTANAVFEASRVALNILINGINADLSYCDGVDVAADPAFADPSDGVNFGPDGVHPTNVGHAAYGAVGKAYLMSRGFT